MSGIVGLLNADDAPVDCALLRRMTRFLAARGPHGAHAKHFGHVALGHTLLDVCEATADRTQPMSIDGARWIVADARLDATSDLIRTLEARGAGNVPPDVSPAELILRAYDV